MIETMFVNDWIALFESIAVNHVLIQHNNVSNKRFFEDDRFLKGNNTPALAVVCFPANSKLSGKLENAKQNYDFELWFIYSCEKDNETQIKTAQANAELLAHDYISALEYMASSYVNPAQTTLAGFKIEECTIDSIGPVTNNLYYGAALTIKAPSMRDFRINNARWLTPYTES